MQLTWEAIAPFVQAMTIAPLAAAAVLALYDHISQSLSD
jgi:hypothetical protein